MKRLTKTGTRLDLGCGKIPKNGFIGLDMIDFGQDIVWDITHGIPLLDDSIDEIYSSHFVEHIAETNIDEMFKEILRVCKVNAIIDIKCPDSSTIEAYYLSHLTLWNESRVKGIVQGVNGWEASKKLKIVEIRREGIELQFKLKVC